MKPSRDYDPAPDLRPPLTLERAISAEDCRAIIALFERSESRPRSYQGLVSDAVRRCDFVKLPPDWDGVFARIAIEHMQPYFGRDIDPTLRDRPMLYGYPEGVGFVPHHDLVTDIEVERGKTNGQPVIGGDYTLVMFLSRLDDYGGGALYFPAQGWRFRPPPGTAIIYPATADYIHGVEAITRGVRHVIVARYYNREHQA